MERSKCGLFELKIRSGYVVEVVEARRRRHVLCVKIVALSKFFPLSVRKEIVHICFSRIAPTTTCFGCKLFFFKRSMCVSVEGFI